MLQVKRRGATLTGIEDDHVIGGELSRKGSPERAEIGRGGDDIAIAVFCQSPSFRKVQHPYSLSTIVVRIQHRIGAHGRDEVDSLP
jgi:hypothetical protein